MIKKYFTKFFIIINKQIKFKKNLENNKIKKVWKKIYSKQINYNKY